MDYTDINATTIDQWAEDGWTWARPIEHEEYVRAQKGDWFVLLSPTKPVPRDWFPEMKGAHVLGLASGGAQQMPVFAAQGAICTVLDYSETQIASEIAVAAREGYEINAIRADMTKPLPFADGSFDLIFHPVSNCYVKDVYPIWRECFRVLKKGGLLLSGLDNGLNYAFNHDETALEDSLPFDPLADPALYRRSIEQGDGIQFSHTIEEQIGGQLKAGFTLCDIYQDTNGKGNLHEHNIPTIFVTKCIKL